MLSLTCFAEERAQKNGPYQMRRVSEMTEIGWHLVLKDSWEKGQRVGNCLECSGNRTIPQKECKDSTSVKAKARHTVRLPEDTGVSRERNLMPAC